jgi:hypothetical protein
MSRCTTGGFWRRAQLYGVSQIKDFVLVKTRAVVFQVTMQNTDVSEEFIDSMFMQRI